MAYAPIVQQTNMLGGAICESLGLDAKNVRAFTMAFRVGELPSLTVEYIRPDLRDDAAAAKLLRAFTLVPKESEE